MKETVFGLMIVFVLVFGAIQFDRASCNARWKDSGISSSYAAMGGCKVMVGGKWIPESSYRTVE